MSAEAFGWAIKQETGSPVLKLVLLALGNHAHEDGTGCFPSVQTLARKTELSIRAVQKALRGLEARGLIVAEARITGSGQRSNNYFLNVDGNWAPQIPPARHAGGANDVREPSAPCAPLPAADSPAPPHDVQGHIESNRQQETKTKRAPKRTQPLNGCALRLAKELGEVKFQSWLGDAVFEEGEQTKIIVPSPFKRNWLLDNFHGPLQRACGSNFVIEVRPPAKNDLPSVEETVASEDPNQQPWWNRADA